MHPLGSRADQISRALESDREELVSGGLMTVLEAASFLRLSRSTIYGLMEKGILPTSGSVWRVGFRGEP